MAKKRFNAASLSDAGEVAAEHAGLAEREVKHAASDQNDHEGGRDRGHAEEALLAAE